MEQPFKQLHSLRKSRKLKQEDVAKMAGISREAYLRAESGRADPRLSTLMAVAGALGLEVVLAPREAVAEIERVIASHPTQPLPGGGSPGARRAVKASPAPWAGPAAVMAWRASIAVRSAILSRPTIRVPHPARPASRARRMPAMSAAVPTIVRARVRASGRRLAARVHRAAPTVLVARGRVRANPERGHRVVACRGNPTRARLRSRPAELARP
ncbi:hypothetical protein ACEQUB_p00358 (plasmid) [Ralstonia syzygii]